MKKSLVRQLKKSTAIATFILLISYLIEYTLGAVLANILGASHYGDYAVTLFILKLCALIAIAGGNQSVIAYIPNYFKTQQWANIAGFICFFLILIAFFNTLLFILIYYLIAPIASKLFFNNNHPLLENAWLIPLFSIQVFCAMVLSAFKHPYWSSITNKLMLPALLIITILIVHQTSKPLTLNFVFHLLNLVLLIIVVTQAFILLKTLPSRVFNQGTSFEQVKPWSLTSLQLLLSGLLFTSYNQVDLLMVEWLSPHEKDTGLFAAVLVIAGIVWLVRSACLLIYNPMLAPLVAENNLHDLKILAKQSARFVFSLTVAVSLLVIIAAPWLLSLFGHDFIGAKWCLIITVIAFTTKPLFLLAEPIIKYTGMQQKNIIPQISCLFLSILIGVVLIPKLSIIGASLSLLISRFILVFWQALIVKRHYQISTFLV